MDELNSDVLLIICNQVSVQDFISIFSSCISIYNLCLQWTNERKEIWIRYYLLIPQKRTTIWNSNIKGKLLEYINKYYTHHNRMFEIMSRVFYISLIMSHQIIPLLADMTLFDFTVEVKNFITSLYYVENIDMLSLVVDKDNKTRI